MLKLMNYEGCGKCPKRGAEFDCIAHRVPVTIKFSKAQKWDNWGHLVTVFRAGDIVEGSAVIDNEEVYCAGATSTIYDDINDFVALEDIEITT